MNDATRPARFPPGFLFGAAMSAYQGEGAIHEDGRTPSIWDTFAATPGAVANGDTGEIAADQYHRWHSDVELMAELRLRLYRFSVSWPRIQPRGRGPANERGLDHYSRIVDDLLAHGITPAITLYHWELPQELQDAGGWANRDTAHRLADFSELVYGRLHDRVDWWSTINEPWCVSLLSHAAGIHAPGLRDPRAAVRAIHHTLLGHGLTVSRLRAIDSRPRHSIVLNVAPIRCTVDDPDRDTARAIRLTDGYRNRVWLDPLLGAGYPEDMATHVERFGGFPLEPGDEAIIATPIDWLGINYYHDLLLAPAPGHQTIVHPGVTGVRDALPPGERTDLGWPITPTGLRDLLVGIHRRFPDAPPMIITENGAAYDDPPGPDGSIDDQRRIRYLEGHLQAVADAIADGVDVRGHVVWSLLDNFEWAEGYRMRFGLVHVDFATQARTPRRSAAWFRDVIERGALPSDPPAGVSRP